LLNNGEPFGCVHVGDSRGMWIGLFSDLSHGYRAPDPATEDMYSREWFRPFSPETIGARQQAGDLNRNNGMYSADCSTADPRMQCNWPTWENCDGFGERVVTDTLVNQHDGLTAATFAIGAGHMCTDVSIVTSLVDAGQQAHMETVETCLYAGENLIQHTVQQTHVVELFYESGYVSLLSPPSAALALALPIPQPYPPSERSMTQIMVPGLNTHTRVIVQIVGSQRASLGRRERHKLCDWRLYSRTSQSHNSVRWGHSHMEHRQRSD
jgi:hypothetical protein